MLSKLRNILSVGLVVVVWGLAMGLAQAQFGGLQIQIGGSPYGGSGLYVGGFGVPFGVGPSIPPTSRAYMGPQYQSGYRGYYGNFGVGPSLGVYGSPLDYPSSTYRNYGYSNHSSIDLLRAQQYLLQRQQLELQAAQRSLSTQQSRPYPMQSSYSVQSPRGSSTASDLRPGMVLPDGSTVISVGPISNSASRPEQPNLAPVAPPNTLPPSSEPKKAAF